MVGIFVFSLLANSDQNGRSIGSACADPPICRPGPSRPYHLRLCRECSIGISPSWMLFISNILTAK